MANHPLPPRPHPLPRPPPPQSTSVPPSPGGLALPRTPYFSAPQPASPRPAGTPSSAFSPHRPSSPKVGAAVAGPGPASSSSASFVAPPEPVVAIRKALQKEGIKTNGDVLEFGHQWTVHWRAWRGAPLLSAAVSPGTNLNGGATGPAIAPGSLSRSHTETSSTLKYNPLAPFSSGATTPVHPLPRPPPAPPLATQDAAAKARSVFDEVIMGAHDAPSPVASTSTTGNATAPPLKDRLQSLQQVSVALDPVEQARAEVLREARAAELSGWVLSLFSLVKVSVVAASKPVEEGGKGKGKEKELEQDAAGRMLWVFSVTRGKSAKEGSDGKSSPASSARERLNALSFPDLTSVGSGHFSHRDLYPSLYPSTPASPSSTTSDPPPLFASPSTLSASSYPSALALSSDLHAEVPTGSTPSKFAAPLEAFLSASSEALLLPLLSDRSSPNHLATRLNDSLVFLPSATEPFGASGRRVTPDAVKSTLRLTVQHDGLLIQPIVHDLPLRPFPPNLPPPIDSPLLLAPFATEATFVKAYPQEAKRGSMGEVAMEESWTRLLQGTGLTLADNESWVLCRITLPSLPPPPTPQEGDPPPPPPPTTETLEVVWPASLTLLDGTKPQPSSSSPPRAKPVDLTAPVATTTSPRRDSTTTTISGDNQHPSHVSPLGGSAVSLPPLDIVTRRRFASSLRRRSPSTSGGTASEDYHDPISSRAEQVGHMLEQLAEEKERAARAELEAQQEALKTAPTPDATATTATSTAGKQQQIVAGQPINMRTPISLGGSSTEAPSPADGFAQVLGALAAGGVANGGSTTTTGGGPFGGPEPMGTTKNAEMDQLYPSPSEAMHLAGIGAVVPLSSGGDSLMATAELNGLGSLGGSGMHSAGGGGGVSGGGGAGLDASFPDFDWGDDFNVGRIQQSGPQDFDDGMMMGLTDDDFSFFDDPAPILPVSTLPSFTNGLQSSGPSPKFVDHFSHLTGTTPFPSAASPTSPYVGGHPSPHLAHGSSPNIFSFDPSQNALGFGSTPAALGIDGSPFKTPRTPYSPFVELLDDHHSHPALAHETPAAATMTFTGFPAPTVSIAGTPAAPPPPLYPFQSALTRGRPSAFEPVPFGQSHTLSDDKYDPRKGKFGLPSPEYDPDDLPALVATPSSASSSDKKKTPWYTTACDPRVHAAVELKRKRTPSLGIKKRTRLSLDGSMAGAPGSKERIHVRPRSWIAATDVGDSDAYGEDDSEDDGMDGIEEASVAGGGNGNGAGGVDDDSMMDDLMFHSSGPGIDYTFGSALLLLRNHLATLLEPIKIKSNETPPVVTKGIVAADSALESALALVADQTMYNPDFRARSVGAKSLKPTSTALVSSHAIQLVHDRLSSLTNSKLAPSTPSQLVVQSPPTILLRAQQSIMQLSTSAIQYWRPMAFEPLAGGKDVTAFAVFEEGGEELKMAVGGWLKSVGEAYEGSRLGTHTSGSIPPQSSFAGVEGGLAVLPQGALSQPRSRDEFKSLASHLIEVARNCRHIVIYLLAPPDAYSTSPSSPIILALQQILKSRSGTMSMVVYPVPLSNVSRHRTIIPGDSTATRLDRLAFSVYDQLLVPVSNLAFPVPETFPSAPIIRPQSLGPVTRLFQSPAMTLSPARATRLEFELHWPASSLEVLHRHRLLHVAYACSPAHGQGAGLEWIVVSCIDEKGEIWKTLPRLLRIPPGTVVEAIRARAVWSITKMLAETADVEWRVVICKLGTPSKAEVRAWDTLLKDALSLSRRPLHVSFVCADLSPPVSVLPVPTIPTTPHPSTAAATPASEEGELGHPIGTTPSTPTTAPSSKPAHLDNLPTIFSYTPSEPVAIDSSSTLVAPISTYLIHTPRIPSLTHHTCVDPFMHPSSSISVLGLHFLGSYVTKTSSLALSLVQHVADVRQSFIELAALGQARWGASGRVAWHVEAVAQVMDLVAD